MSSVPASFKKIIPVLVLIVCSQPVTAQSIPALPPNPLTFQLPAKGQTISFHWKGDTLQHEWNPHTAILLPVKLEGCHRQFYMQFDLGAPYSLLYKNKINGILKQFPNTKLTIDSSGTLQSFSFRVGHLKVQAATMELRQFDTAPLSAHQQEIIGTLGADLIDNKVLIMNYPRQQLTLIDSIPAKLASQLTLNGFMFARRAVLLPAIILGKRTMLYFDTGSSAYQLLTDQQTWQKLAAPGAVPSQYAARSWNKMLTAHTIQTNDSLTIASQTLPIRKVTYIEGASNSQISMMMKMGIGGMTGNTLFLDHILVLDTKHQQFGLMPSYPATKK